MRQFSLGKRLLLALSLLLIRSPFMAHGNNTLSTFYHIHKHVISAPSFDSTWFASHRPTLDALIQRWTAIIITATEPKVTLLCKLLAGSCNQSTLWDFRVLDFCSTHDKSVITITAAPGVSCPMSSWSRPSLPSSIALFMYVWLWYGRYLPSQRGCRGFR